MLPPDDLIIRGLTLDNVALHFDVTRRTVERWIATGLLRAYKVGPRTVRVHPDDLDALVHPR